MNDAITKAIMVTTVALLVACSTTSKRKWFRQNQRAGVTFSQ